MREDFSLSHGQNGSLGLARESLNSNVMDLPVRLIEIFQNVGAASCDRKWDVFEQWCTQKHVFPFLCSVVDVFSARALG